MSSGGAGYGLVGREEALAGIIRSVRRPELRGAWVTGELGIGKSAIAGILSTCMEEDFVPISLRASHSLSSVPYGVFFPVLGGVDAVTLRSPVMVLRCLKRYFAEKESASGRRALLLVDDAHDLERESRHMLEQLFLADSFKLVALTEGDGRTPREFHALCPDSLLTRIQLQPLGRDDVGVLVRRLLNGPVAPGTIDHLAWASSGNPLFLRAMLTDGVRTGHLTRANSVWCANPAIDVLDQSLKDLGRELLLRRSAEERTVLETVALMGSVPTKLIGGLVDNGDALQNLLHDGTLENPRGAINKMRLRHPIMCHVIRSLVPAGRSAAILRRLTDQTGEVPIAATGRVRWTEWCLETGHLVEDTDIILATQEAYAQHQDAVADKLAAGISTPQLAVSVRMSTRRGHSLGSDALASARRFNHEGRYAESEGILRHLVDETEEGHRIGVVARSLLGEAMAGMGRSSEAAEYDRRTVDLVASTPELRDLFHSVLVKQLVSLLQNGRYKELTAAIKHSFPKAPRGMRHFTGEMNSIQGVALVRRGYVRAGLEQLRAGIEVMRGQDPELLRPHALAVAAYAASQLGSNAQLDAFRAEVASLTYLGPKALQLINAAYLAVAAHAPERPLALSPILCQLAQEAQGGGMTAAERTILEILVLAEGCVPPERLEQLALEDPQKALVCFVAAARANEPQQLLHAAVVAEEEEHPLFAVECRARAAIALAGHDIRRQRAVLQTVRRLNSTMGGARTAALDKCLQTTQGLTRREKEVVKLAIGGSDNQAIADTLTVSLRTVEGHLYRAYLKLGIINRSQLRLEHLSA